MKLSSFLVLVSFILLNYMNILSYQKVDANIPKKKNEEIKTSANIMTISRDSLNRKMMESLINEQSDTNIVIKNLNRIILLQESHNTHLGWILLTLIFISIVATILNIWLLIITYKKSTSKNGSMSDVRPEKDEKLHQKIDLLLYRTASGISQKIEQSVENAETNLTILSTYQEEVSKELDESSRADLIGVSYEFVNNRIIIKRQDNSEYFYIIKNKSGVKLHATENILNQVPSQEVEGTISKFFRITRIKGSTKYKLISPASISWDISKDEGTLDSKGEITQAL